MATRCGVAVVVVMMMMMVCGNGVDATTAAPPHVKMVTAAPRPEALVMLKDCPVYVFGELRVVKKHGETWQNDGSACEMCECVDGLKRCYYHYCNERLTEGFMTPPSGRPPLDDEDREDGGDGEMEGSGQGHHALPDDYYKVVNHITAQESWDVVGGGGGGNEAQDIPMCSPQCHKSCPWGFKVDKSRGCLRCKCHKCSNLPECHIRCLGGLARDARGCRVCRCRSKGLSLMPTSTHHHRTNPNTQTPPATKTTTTATHNNHNHQDHHGHAKGTCNDTDGATPVQQQRDDSGTWHDYANRRPHDTTHHHDTHEHRANNDGTTKSAVQVSSGVEWWQVWVIATPLVLAAVLVCGAVMRYWRRYHHDKYRINAYRPTETEKLRPVTTADDHINHHNNYNLRTPHL